jgi:hypothetical protein
MIKLLLGFCLIFMLSACGKETMPGPENPKERDPNTTTTA